MTNALKCRKKKTVNSSTTQLENHVFRCKINTPNT